MSVELNPITSGYSTGLINDNFQLVEDEVNNNVLRRQGLAAGEANQMEVGLDMNSNFVYNLPEPTLEHQAARLQDVQNALAGGAANLITFTPAAGLSSENVQAAIEEVANVGGLSVTTSTGTQSIVDALDDEDRLNNTVTPEQFGAVGDGVTDDTAAIESAFTDGRVVVGASGATYRITSARSYSGFVDFKANGSSLLLDFTLASPSYALTFSGGSRIDSLEISVPTAIVIDRVVLFSGTTSHIVGNISITSVDQQNNRNGADDCAVHITASGAKIGAANVVNYDNPYVLAGASLTAGRISFSSFVRGVYFDNITEFEIDTVIGNTTSPNALVSPGHNGLLFEGSSNGRISWVDIEDAGEHGIRFGGGGGGCSDIHIDYLRAHNSGGCGLKLRPNVGETHDRVSFGTVVASDSGTEPGLGPNEEGVLLERTLNCHIDHVHIFAVNQAASCARGIRVNSSTGLTVSNALIDDCDDQGVFLENTDDNGTTFKNLTDIHINAVVNGGLTNGVTILTDNIDLRSIFINARVRNASGYAFTIVGSGSFLTLCEFYIRSDDNTSGAVNISSTIGGSGFVKIDVIDSTIMSKYSPSNSISAISQAYYSDVGGSYTQRCVIRGDGDLENVNNSYGALSDSRIKTEVYDSPSQWDDVKALRTRKFYNKLSNSEQIGLVAQEVEEVSPGLTTTLPEEEGKALLQSAWPDATEEEINQLLSQGPVLSVKYSVLNIKLLKVIQELQERVEALEAR